MDDGAFDLACGGAERWSRDGGDTLRPASIGLRWKRSKAARRTGTVSQVARRLISDSCPEGGSPPIAGQSWLHFPTCTLLSPFDSLTIGTNHRAVGRGRAADLLDARAVGIVPALLEQVGVVVQHLRQPVLRVPDERLLAGEPLVVHGHVAVGVVVEAVGTDDALDRMVRTGIAVALPA